jgi:hypothetical protein
MIVRSVCVAMSLVLMSGCISFARKYNETIYQKLGAVNSELTKIETVIEARAPRKARYSEVEGYYIAALSSVKEAQDLADRRPAYLGNQPASQAAQLSADNIRACREEIESSRAGFEADGQGGDELGDLAVLRNICAIPKTMEGLLK